MAIELITYAVGCRYSAVQYCKIVLIDGLVRDCGVSNALAMEMLQSCAKPSICNYRNWDRVSVRCWNHRKHHISHPNARAMGCLLWVFVRKLTTIWRHCNVYRNEILHVIVTHRGLTMSYCTVNLGLHWLRWWLFDGRTPNFELTNVD